MKRPGVIKASKEEIVQHLKRAHERLRSAEVLFKEGLYSDAVSRAYYACFEAASGALLLKGVIAKTHAGLLQLFSLYFVKTKKIDQKYGRLLKKIEDLRGEADYEVFRRFTEAEAQEAIGLAKEFIKEVENSIIKNHEKK